MTEVAAAVTTATLRMEGVCKTYPGVRALDDVTFAAMPGRVHALVGENGAGKSTLMAVASGAVKPDSGIVSLNGQEVQGDDPRSIRLAGLAIVHQEPALLPDLTVAENLFLGSAPRLRPPARQLNAWAHEVLRSWDEDVAVSPRARVAFLNPEQRFIVEICRALAQTPSVLVLDEPTEHLAHEDVDILFRKIRELRDRGSAVVYISHRIREVLKIADQVTVLRDGRIQGSYAVSEVDEARVVNLIAGRPLTQVFPDKSGGDSTAPAVLQLQHASGRGFTDVTLTVRANEIVGLAGIEGNGQRDLLRAMAGLQSWTSAPEQRTGRDGASWESLAGRIQYLPADRHREGIAGDLSVRENLALRTLGDYATGGFVRRSRERAMASAAVEKLRIKTPSVETAVGSLSGGNQQKVVISGVLQAQPAVVLADEPTQGVDVGTRSEIYGLLRRAAASGTGVVVLSSDALELAGLCDRVLVFSRGRITRELQGESVTERAIAESILTSTESRQQARGANRAVMWLAGDTAPLLTVSIAIAVLAAVATALNPYYLTSRGISGILALAATLALVACGQQLAMIVGGIDLSVGPLMGTLVVTLSFFMVNGTSLLAQGLGWLLFLIVAFATGVTNWILIEAFRLPAMIATLATYMALQAISLVLRPVPGGVISANVTKAVTAKLGPVPVTFVAAVLVACVLQYVLVRTVLGMSLRGTGSRPEAARKIGVPVRAMTLVAYVGCSLLAAAAAIPLMAQVGIGDPGAGVNYTLSGIAAVVIGGASIFGGRGSFVGALLGALLICQVNAVAAFLQLSEAWNWLILGATIIIAVALYSKSRQLAVPR